jgi:phage replication O-like protein O
MAKDLLCDRQNPEGPGGTRAFQKVTRSKNTDRDAEKFTKVPNEILEKVIGFGFTRRELLVVLVVVRRTCGWHKEIDKLSYWQVSEMTGIDRRTVRRIMLRLGHAGVFLRGNRRPGRAPYDWGIEKRTELWSRDVIQGSRECKATRKAEFLKEEDAPERVKSTLSEGVKLTPCERVKVTPICEGQINPPQKKELKKEKERRKKCCAAFAARMPFSSSSSEPTREKEGGSLRDHKDGSLLVATLSPSVEPQMDRCDQVRIAQLCGELETGDLNPYPWLAEKRRGGVPAAQLIEVLEKAVIQQPGAADFDAFAEKQYQELCASG